MVNYQQGKIYKIISDSSDKVYIGSTTKEYLCQRMGGHMQDYKKYLNGEIHCYCASFELIKNNDYKIILIEKFPCNSKDELRMREQYHIEEYSDLCLNKKNAFTNQKEYKKQYIQNNREKIREQRKQYVETNKDLLKEKGKEYYESTKEMKAKYYEDNKEHISQRRKEKIPCFHCQKEISRGNIAIHLKRCHQE